MISQLVFPVGARCIPSLTFYAIRYIEKISKFTSPVEPACACLEGGMTQAPSLGAAEKTMLNDLE